MKRKICLIMVTVMVMFAVAGCGNSAGKAEEKVDDPKPEVSAVEDQSAEDDQNRSEESEEVTDAEEGSEQAEDNEAEPAEAGDDQSSDSENVDNAEASDEPEKDGNTPITDEDIAELKSYIKEAVISEYLDPNGLTADQLEWPEDWHEFAELQRGAGVSLSMGMTKEITVESPTDAVWKGIEKWFLNQGTFGYSYFHNVMSKLEPFYESIPAIDYSAE